MLATKDCHELLAPTLPGETRPDNWCKQDYGVEYISAQVMVGPGLSGCPVSESKYLCKKGASLGSADVCCEGKDIAWGYSCDSSYLNYGSGACDNTLEPYCSGPMLFADPNCLLWVQERPDQAKNNIQAYCNTIDGINDPNCLLWCQSNQGECDVSAASYCQNNPGDPFCSCLNSALPSPNCFDIDCQSKNGYVTTAMKNQTCGSFTQCTQINNLSAQDKASLNNVQFKQSCGNNPPPTSSSSSSTPPASSSSSQSTTSNVPTTSSGGTTTVNTPPPPTSTSSTSLYFVYFIVFLALVILIVYLVKRHQVAQRTN